MASENKERNILLDSFRVLAVLMVLLVHGRGYLQGTPALIHNFFGLGAYGVALYFIISGYLASYSISKDGFSKYVKKKAIRILPMYVIALLFTFILGGLILGIYPISFEWIYHVFFLNMIIPAKEWMWWNSVNYFWTMPAFVLWYLLSYPLMKIVKKSGAMFLVTLGVVAFTPILKKWLLLVASEQFVNWNFSCLLYVFLLGVLASYIIKENKHFVGAIYGAIIGGSGYLVGNRSGFLLFGLFFYFAIIICDRLSFRWNNEKVNSFFRTWSAATWSTYLSHWFLLVLFGNVMKQMNWIVAISLFIIIANLFGYFLYLFVEKPCYRVLSNKLLRRES